jgi:hypothetical protein
MLIPKKTVDMPNTYMVMVFPLIRYHSPPPDPRHALRFYILQHARLNPASGERVNLGERFPRAPHVEQKKDRCRRR